jgi:hypothetical protein
MDGRTLGPLWSLLDSFNIMTSLVQVGATTVDLCVPDRPDQLDQLANNLIGEQSHFQVENVEHGLTLMTVFNPPDPEDPLADIVLPTASSSNGRPHQTPIIQQQSANMVQILMRGVPQVPPTPASKEQYSSHPSMSFEQLSQAVA